MGKLQAVISRSLKGYKITKTTVATVLFILWIGFFSENNLIEGYRMRSTVSKMKQEKKTLIAAIAQAKRDREDLDRNIEKYAREKYFMHKDNEEVFIIDKK